MKKIIITTTHEVLIFSKSTCPFCYQSKALFEKLNIDAQIFELDEMENGAIIQKALHEVTGQRTVPNIFINGDHVGGNDKIQQAARSGELENLLN